MRQFSWDHDEWYNLCCFYLIHCWLDPAVSSFYFQGARVDKNNKANTEFRKTLEILEKVAFV